MNIFGSLFVSKIKSNVKKKVGKSMAMTILFAIATRRVAKHLKVGPSSLDLSPFAIPAEQMYALSIEMQSEGLLC